MIALLFIAVSLGLSNLAATIGIGVSGVDNRTRLHVGLIFGVLEAGMPIVNRIRYGRFLVARPPRSHADSAKCSASNFCTEKRPRGTLPDPSNHRLEFESDIVIHTTHTASRVEILH